VGPAVLSRVYNKREKAESEAQSGHALTKGKHIIICFKKMR
jgi:hypothetical protein